MPTVSQLVRKGRKKKEEQGTRTRWKGSVSAHGRPNGTFPSVSVMSDSG